MQYCTNIKCTKFKVIQFCNQCQIIPEGILTETCSMPANIDTMMYYCILQRTEFGAFRSFFTRQRVNIYRTTLNQIIVLEIIIIINKLNPTLWNIVLLERVNIPSTMSKQFNINLNFLFVPRLVYNKHLFPQHISRQLCNKHISYCDRKSLLLAHTLRIIQ